MTDNTATESPCPLFDKITEWLSENNWEFDSTQEAGDSEYVASASVRCSNGVWKLIVRSNEDLKQLYLWAVLDQFVSLARRPAMAEFMTKFNYTNRIGSLGMDFSDGQIHFNVSVAVADGEVTSGQITEWVDCCLDGMNDVFIDLMRCMYLDGASCTSDAIEGKTVNNPEQAMPRSLAIH